MLTIAIKEINSFLSSLVAYLVIIVFLLLTGLFIWVFPEFSILEYGYSELTTLFDLGPYLFLLLIPAITMRSFAEEQKSGTLELLLTKPVSDLELVVGKYLGCLALVGLALLPTLVFYYSVFQLGSPVGNIDSAAFFSSFLGLFLLGGVFTSIGIFASSVSDNQIFSFILGVLICYFLYAGLGYVASLSQGSTADLITELGLEYQFNALSKGLIDSRNVVYFLSEIGVMLLATKTVLASRKW
jgi:ABC-2 type transport system permease protein